jgi:DNA-binding transcriptional LysR family regulator
LRRNYPQQFHLDGEAAKATLFSGLAASGWHTAAITMKLLVESGLPLRGGIIGAGIANLPEMTVAAAISEGKLVPLLRNWEPRMSGLFLYYSSRRPSARSPAGLHRLHAAAQKRCSIGPNNSAGVQLMIK